MTDERIEKLHREMQTILEIVRDEEKLPMTAGVASLFVDEIFTALRDARRDSALLDHAQECYVAADFNYPQYEGESCLIIALPAGRLVNVNLRETLAGIVSAPPETTERAEG